jgi:hypothetical protein
MLILNDFLKSKAESLPGYRHTAGISVNAEREPVLMAGYATVLPIVRQLRFAAHKQPTPNVGDRVFSVDLNRRQECFLGGRCNRND